MKTGDDRSTEKSASKLDKLDWNVSSESDDELEMPVISNDNLRKEWSTFMTEYARFAGTNPIKFWLEREKVNI